MSGEAPRRCCRACHFLAKLTPPTIHAKDADNSPTPSELSHDERELLAGGGPASSVVGKASTIACYRGVWDQGYITASGLKKSQKEIITGERGESCFFYPFTPGMFFPAARELERRQANRREGERDREVTREEGQKDRRHTRRAFKVAFLAVVIAATAILADLGWNIWQHFNLCTPAMEKQQILPPGKHARPPSTAPARRSSP